MFPRPAKDNANYRPFMAELAYWILTVSTAVRVLGELARPTFSNAWLRWMIVIPGVGQVIALLLFFQTMWSRIRALGSRVREQSGEKF